MAFLCALSAIRDVADEVPVNLIFALEGEEEINSPSLKLFADERKGDLADADAMYFHRARQDEKGIPRLVLGNKGEMDLTFRVEVRPEDTHSGGRAPGFRKGLSGFERLRAYSCEPTINIHGLASGYVGPRFLNTVPARAEARVDVTLVPEMDFDTTFRKIRDHLDKHGFRDVEVECTAGYTWSRTDLNADVVQALIRSYRKLGHEPQIWPTEGGSRPDDLWTQVLGIPAVGGGLGHGGKAHSPNEYLVVQGFRDSIKSAVTFLYEYADA